MIQLGDITELKAKDIPSLVMLVQTELRSRKELFKRYHRKEFLDGLVYSNQKSTTKVPFEKYIVDIATGFLGGKEPIYQVETTSNDSKIKAIKDALEKDVMVPELKEQMQEIINYIAKYNDDGTEHYELIKDLLMCRGAYEIIYQNKNDEIVYSRLNPLETIAIWDYSIPKNLIGLVRVWNEKGIRGDYKCVCEITDINGTRKYRSTNNGQTYAELKDEFQNNNWGDVPAFAVEIDESIFEHVVDLINAYEQLIQNTRNMFDYNDQSKLGISGYEAENPMTITDASGNVVQNPARMLEDKMVLEAKTMYFNDGGSAGWIEKNINDSAIQNTLKTYIDLIMMNAGVPNTFDLGFTNADNASAIDRNFFSLTSMTTNIIQMLKMAYLRRWELIFGRINLRRGTDFDFRDIKVDLPQNQPSNESELIDMWLKLRDVISDETIVSRLPLDLEYASEKQKLDDESNANFEMQMERMSKQSLITSEVEDEAVSEDRQDIKEAEQE